MPSGPGAAKPGNAVPEAEGPPNRPEAGRPGSPAPALPSGPAAGGACPALGLLWPQPGRGWRVPSTLGGLALALGRAFQLCGRRPANRRVSPAAVVVKQAIR